MTFNLASGLEGKGVIVTGAAGGIGREVALAFAAAGARVAAVDLDQDAVDAVRRGDGRRPASRRSAGPPAGRRARGDDRAGRRSFGRLDVLVQTAAVLVRRPSDRSR